MKRLLLCGVIAFCTTLHAKNLTSINDIYKLKDKQFEDCNVSGFSLLKLDKDFIVGLNARLKPFGALKADDFDMSECLAKRNLQNNVITTFFWQKNNEILEQHMQSYIAYDRFNKNMLVILLDNDLNTYILGNRDQYLIDALKNSREPDDGVFNSINWNSSRSFRELGLSKGVPSKDDLIEMENQRYAIEKKGLLCKAAFDIADYVMKARQDGITKINQLETLRQNPHKNSDYTKYEFSLIDKAYDEPAYETNIEKFAVTKRFAYKTFFDCYKSISSLIP
jgi:hypothetical protein